MPLWSYLIAAAVLGIIGLSALIIRRSRARRARYYYSKKRLQRDPAGWDSAVVRPPAPPRSRPSAARDPFLMQLPGELDAIVKGLEILKQGREELLQESEQVGKALALRFDALEEGILRLEQHSQVVLEAINLRLSALEGGQTKDRGRGKDD